MMRTPCANLIRPVNQLDMLVVNLQNAVMKTRMQPIGRLFNKYPRLARDLARSLGKDVELVLIWRRNRDGQNHDRRPQRSTGAPGTQRGRSRCGNVEERIAAGKPEKSLVELTARQEGDHILITIADDGRACVLK